MRAAALREVGINPTLHYRFDLHLLIHDLQRFPRVQYSKNKWACAWFRLHADSKAVSQREHFCLERAEIHKRIVNDPQQQPLGLGAGHAVLLAASRTAGAWQMDTTYKTLGRVLRGRQETHAV